MPEHLAWNVELQVPQTMGVRWQGIAVLHFGLAHFRLQGVRGGRGAGGGGSAGGRAASGSSGALSAGCAWLLQVHFLIFALDEILLQAFLLWQMLEQSSHFKWYSRPSGLWQELHSGEFSGKILCKRHFHTVEVSC